MELKLTSVGRLLQTLTTLSENKVQRISAICGFKTLYLCSLVWGTELSVKNLGPYIHVQSHVYQP